MNTINRISTPEFRTIEKIDMIKAKESLLDNGIPVYSINAGPQDIVKIDFFFNAGIWFEDFPLVSSSVNSMLTEGTRKLTSMEIVEKIDFYGSFLQLDSGKHTSNVTLYSLNKYLDDTLEIIEDIIKNSIFPEKEFTLYVQKRKQRFLIEAEKVETIAREKFSKAIFGDVHPYGKNPVLSDFELLKSQHLKEFYFLHYNSNNCKIVVSGKVDDKVIFLLNKFFGKESWNNIADRVTERQFQINISTEKKHFVEKPGAVQSAIRIGKALFNKHHPDFIGLDIVNTILGGYFGSRLMTNIREDKGYTYGIGSALVSMVKSGYFAIISEVGKDVCDDACKEIKIELNRLRTEDVKEEELTLVRNYMMGDLLRAFDGPFALANSFRSIMEYNLSYDYFDNYIEKVKNISSGEIRQLANKYLHEDSMIEVIAGSK